MQTRFQTWMYRIGLVGIVLLAIVAFSLTRNQDGAARLTTSDGTDDTTTETGPPLSTPPGADVPFTLSAPIDGHTYNTAFLSFIGRGPTGATVHVGDATAEIGETGTFAIVVQVQLGENHFVVTATTPDGKSSSLELTVYYEITTTTTVDHTHPSVDGPKPSTTKPPKTTTTKPSTTSTAGGTTSTTSNPVTTSTTEPPPTTTTQPPPTTTTTTEPPPTTCPETGCG